LENTNNDEKEEMMKAGYFTCTVKSHDEVEEKKGILGNYIQVETQLTLQLLVQVIPVKPDETESDVKKLIQYLPKSTDVSKSKAKTV
ncbi:11078_t:CDS:2, partial [Entrophospora sp. SA101]